MEPVCHNPGNAVVLNHELLSTEDDDDKLPEEPSPQQQQRKLSLIDGVAIVVGIVIGSGIFSSPGLALERSGSPGLVLVAWSVSGIVVVLMAECYIELGAMMPSAGGDFDYLKSAYGERLAFSFAWYNFFVGKTGSQAIIATIFGRYFEAVLKADTTSLQNGTDSEESVTAKLCAVLLVVCITLINCCGIKESAVLSIIMTTTKVALVLMVFIFSVAYESSGSQYSEVAVYNLSPDTAFNNSNGISHFGSAMVACLWCFDGFADGNFLMEELKHPIRDLPRIIKYAVLIVTSCYILINIGYLSVLSRESIINSKAIAVDFGSTVSLIFSNDSRNVLPIILALGVSLSTIGSLNGSAMTGGRAFHAVARDGKAPQLFTRLNFVGAPYASLLAQGGWSIVLLMLPGSNFASLLNYFGPTSWCFYALTASALITLRIRNPDTDRPYKIPLYPLPPLIVICLAGVILVSSLMVSPLFILLALGFVSLSFPVHVLMEWYSARYTGNQQRFVHEQLSVVDNILNDCEVGDDDSEWDSIVHSSDGTRGGL